MGGRIGGSGVAGGTRDAGEGGFGLGGNWGRLRGWSRKRFGEVGGERGGWRGVRGGIGGGSGGTGEGSGFGSDGEVVEDLGEGGGHAEGFAVLANGGLEHHELAEVAEGGSAARGDFADGQGAEDDGEGALHFGFGGWIVLEGIKEKGFVEFFGGAVAEFFEVAMGTAKALGFVVACDGLGAAAAVGELIFAEVPEGAVIVR